MGKINQDPSVMLYIELNHALIPHLNLLYFVQISRGYSETVTIFYAHIIADAISKSDAEEQTFEEFITKNKYIEAKDLLFKYYSLETIQSKESAVRFVFVIFNGSRSVVDPAPHPLKLVKKDGCRAAAQVSRVITPHPVRQISGSVTVGRRGASSSQLQIPFSSHGHTFCYVVPG